MAIQDATATLRRVYVRSPRATDAMAWRDYAWNDEPDPVRAADEHAALRRILEDFGAKVVDGETEVPGDIDSIYAYDASLITDAGAILLRPGKEGRRAEPDALGADLEAAGVPIVDRVQAPGTAEGGDMFWLDEQTLVVGRGSRTNDEGIAQLRAFLEPMGAAVVWFDLPYFRGPSACMHLMTFISPLDRDLAVVFPPLVPVRMMELLEARGISIVEVPDDELDSQGPNVLALGPRIALALEGNPGTRRRMEAAGVDVRTYAGREISLKGDGGPTCLTRPLERG
jgi:dimethylargininase